MIIPSGVTTWQGDPSWSQTSPARFKTTPPTVTPCQSGHHRGATPAPPSSAKSQCGAPATASIPKTRDQPEEEANWRQPPPCGNSASTGRSPVPPIRQTTRGLTNDRQHTPHLVAGTTTASARTKDPDNVRTRQPHPADSTLQASDRVARNRRLHLPAATAGWPHNCRNLALCFRSRASLRSAGGARALASPRAAPPLALV
jgi:hypothetical protein